MVSYYLNSYRPLCFNPTGRAAITKHGLPPFIDGSCRREPDFESKAPSISALCRKEKFAPRLIPNDHIIYTIVQLLYDGEPGWALVASLNVIEQFKSHEAAANWYGAQKYVLPSNCLIPDNPPQPFHLTTQKLPKEVAARVGNTPDPVLAVRLWDATYSRRARDCGLFLACRTDFLELWHPPILRLSDFLNVFGKKPSTQNPPKISLEQYQGLMEFTKSG
ncbi:MAG TPA: hypothetical protein VNI02_13925 [Blastocatellia bacterium]|jgi:hypothetical protein|nr:hypothetical protein [Blastocatellia bacterium]